MRFKTSAATQEFIENVHARLGAENPAILGLSGLFLALGEGVPPDFKLKDTQGKELNDETVVSHELRDVVRAALTHRAGEPLDEERYKQQFRRYFEYGCQRLRDLWEECGSDHSRFVGLLLKLCGSDFSDNGEGSEGFRKSISPLSIVTNSVKLKLLVDSEEWVINRPGQNGLMVISGRSGLGKSQLALDLLAQIARQGVRFVFFDLKGELEENAENQRQVETRNRFLSLTGASYVRLIREALPINPLLRASGVAGAESHQIAYELASLIRSYAPQLGSKQERAICEAYQRLERPDFSALAAELENNGGDGVAVALIQKVRDYGLFSSDSNAISPEKWLSRSLVIDFKQLGNDEDTKSLAVALVLNLLVRRLNQSLAITNGVQPLKMVLFVDEAHLLLPKEGKAGLLGSLARQGRSWGFPVWLASQDADAFLTTGAKGVNFGELAECGIHFSPQTLSEREQRDILGGVIRREPNQGEALLRLSGKQSTGAVRQFWKDQGK